MYECCNCWCAIGYISWRLHCWQCGDHNTRFLGNCTLCLVNSTLISRFFSQFWTENTLVHKLICYWTQKTFKKTLIWQRLDQPKQWNVKDHVSRASVFVCFCLYSVGWLFLLLNQCLVSSDWLGIEIISIYSFRIKKFQAHWWPQPWFNAKTLTGLR